MALLREGGGESLRSVEVRRIYAGTDLTGFILVADAQIRPNEDALALAGFEVGVGDEVTKRRVKVVDHDALSGIAGGAGYVAWIEAPFVEMVFAQSESTANELAIAFLRD